MALRAEKRISALLTILAFSPALFAQQSFEFQAWHGHSRPPHVRKAGNFGRLTIDERGISFEESYTKGKPPKQPHKWHWEYVDIEQLEIAAQSLKVTTYQDNKWKLGADREYRFDLTSDKNFEQVYNLLKNRLDQRFVAAIPDKPNDLLWELPVKHLNWPGGDEGTLRVGTDRIVYDAADHRSSRTWRYEDIDNVSSSGPFDLTFVTFERARLDYGSRKQFAFQLKQRLDESRYNDLWLRLNQAKGLKVLGSYRDKF